MINGLEIHTLIFTCLVKMWYEHDAEVSISPIDIVLICTCKPFCFLEERKHISPAPSWISEVLPFLKVFTMPTKVQHPVKHAAEKAIKLRNSKIACCKINIFLTKSQGFKLKSENMLSSNKPASSKCVTSRVLDDSILKNPSNVILWLQSISPIIF